MSDVLIAVLNRSTVLTDDQLQPVMAALQTQVRRDWAPVWGSDADLSFVPAGAQPAAGSWWLVILDDSNQAGALGYHDLTTEGLPLGKVFAHSDLTAGLQWSVTASHELLEMLGDPDINLTAFVQPDASSGTLYAYEVCDACEADQYGYAIDSVTVSDFVYPPLVRIVPQSWQHPVRSRQTHHRAVSAAARGLHRHVRRHHWDRLAPTHRPSHFTAARDARPRRQPPRTPPHPARPMAQERSVIVPPVTLKTAGRPFRFSPPVMHRPRCKAIATP
jgi:hypothetical protein